MVTARCRGRFISRLFALAMPMLIYGSNTLFFFIYTAFLALMPVAVVVGIALHSMMDGKLRYGIVFTGDSRHYVWRTVYVATGLICTFPSPLFIIQTVTNNEIMFCATGIRNNGQMWYICPRCRGIPNRGCRVVFGCMG